MENEILIWNSLNWIGTFTSSTSSKERLVFHNPILQCISSIFGYLEFEPTTFRFYFSFALLQTSPLYPVSSGDWYCVESTICAKDWFIFVVLSEPAV